MLAEYMHAHYLVRRDRGRASEWWCCHCDSRAQHWAYDGEDLNQLTDERGRHFSLDVERYFSLCRSCHRRFDFPAPAKRKPKRPGIGACATRTHCPRGHAYVEGNMYVYYHEDGRIKQRLCRTCSLARWSNR